MWPDDSGRRVHLPGLLRRLYWLGCRAVPAGDRGYKRCFFSAVLRRKYRLAERPMVRILSGGALHSATAPGLGQSALVSAAEPARPHIEATLRAAIV